MKNLPMLGLDWETCIAGLRRELEAVKPNVIVCLGDDAMRAVTGRKGITNNRGSILRCAWDATKTIPTFHPAHLLHMEGEAGEMSAYWQKYVIVADLRRVAEEMGFPDVHLPQRTLEIARSSLDLYRFLQIYKGASRCSVDIESVKCLPVCIGLAFNKDHAISVPLVDVFCRRDAKGIPQDVAISRYELAEMWRMCADLLIRKDIEIIGQNFKYDQDKLYRSRFVVGNFFWDTMLMSHTLDPELPQSLAFNTSFRTREPFYKDEWEEWAVKGTDWKKLFTYNARDAAVTYEIFESQLEDLQELNLVNYYREEVHPLHNLYWEIESWGIRSDPERQKELQKKYTALWEVQQKELDDLLGWKQRPQGKNKIMQACNVESKGGKDPQVALAIKELGLPMRKKTDEDTLVALLGNQCKTERQKRGIELIISIRKIRKTLTTYVGAKPDYDGRWRTSYRITGTETGRTSTATLKKPIREDKLSHAFQTLTKHGDLGQEIREMYVPDPGMVLFNIDLSQAEARIVALLSDDQELLTLFDTIDIHSLTAAGIFGGDYKQYVKTPDGEPPERFIGKTTRHAGNYGMKKHRLMQEVNTNAKKYGIDISISEWRAGKILEAFHEMTPKIRGVFHARIQDLLVTNERVLINPFGRRRTFYERWGEDLFKEAYAYLPQSTVSDHLKRSMVRIKRERPWIKIMMEAHDAILGQERPEMLAETVKYIQQVLMAPIDFSMCSIPGGKIVIPADIETGDINYKSLRKFKMAA